jgi:hypothetical protein
VLPEFQVGPSLSVHRFPCEENDRELSFCGSEIHSRSSYGQGNLLCVLSRADKNGAKTVGAQVPLLPFPIPGTPLSLSTVLRQSCDTFVRVESQTFPKRSHE